MKRTDDTMETECCPQAWGLASRNVAVNHLLDRISPNLGDCDVERAILGASLGG